MRRLFAETLYKIMARNKKVWLLTGDLGFGMFDKIRDDFPDRYINCGVAEQNMIGMACGMAQGGLIPFIYSITPFLLYRPFEFIRNDVDHDCANVKLVGSGRERDYAGAGFSHWCEEQCQILGVFNNIETYFPEEKEVIPDILKAMVRTKKPCYLNLSR